MAMERWTARLPGRSRTRCVLNQLRFNTTSLSHRQRQQIVSECADNGGAEAARVARMITAHFANSRSDVRLLTGSILSRCEPLRAAIEMDIIAAVEQISSTPLSPFMRSIIMFTIESRRHPMRRLMFPLLLALIRKDKTYERAMQLTRSDSTDDSEVESDPADGPLRARPRRCYCDSCYRHGCLPSSTYVAICMECSCPIRAPLPVRLYIGNYRNYSPISPVSLVFPAESQSAYKSGHMSLWQEVGTAAFTPTVINELRSALRDFAKGGQWKVMIIRHRSLNIRSIRSTIREVLLERGVYLDRGVDVDLDEPGCRKCGCSSMVDEDNEVRCYCDMCQSGCDLPYEGDLGTNWTLMEFDRDFRGPPLVEPRLALTLIEAATSVRPFEMATAGNELVGDAADLMWLSDPRRYRIVVVPAGAVASVLIAHWGSAIIFNGVNVIAKFERQCPLPNGTILVGFLSGDTFVAYDIVAISGSRVWHHVDSKRFVLLKQLLLSASSPIILANTMPSTKGDITRVVSENRVLFVPNLPYSFFDRDPLMWECWPSEIPFPIADMLGAVCITSQSCSPLTGHRALSMPFADLYSLANRLVVDGVIHRTRDAETALEVFSYIPTCADHIVDIFRGLIVHPPSASIVALPFARFGLIDGVTRDEIVSATLKFDGTLIIAFVWAGELFTSTKKKMDSEQARWAREWLLDHCDTDMLKPGKTYLFEAIYEDNVVIVRYPFEGVVLLGVIDNVTGTEAPYQERVELATKLGDGVIMAAPEIMGPRTLLIEQLSRASNASPADRHEGWVLQGDGGREKIVSAPLARARSMTRAMHLRSIWAKIVHGTFQKMLITLPVDKQAEAIDMASAIKVRFAVPGDLFHGRSSMLKGGGLMEETRLQILADACPAVGDVLVNGYSPSSSFRQNWSKGWPNDVVMTRNGDQAPIARIHDDVIGIVLSMVSSRFLPIISATCIAMYRVARKNSIVRSRLYSAMIDRIRLLRNEREDLEREKRRRELSYQELSEQDSGYGSGNSYKNFKGYSSDY